MPFQKGNKLGGRTEGAIGKLTANAKEAFQLAFDSIGGYEALALWALQNQTDFYKIYGRLIPVDTNLVVEMKPEARVYPLGLNEQDRLSPPSEAVESLH